LKKVLMFSLLDSLNSGHHHAANAIIYNMKSRTTDIECKSVDIVNYWNPWLENMINGTTTHKVSKKKLS